jgi:hypothetical protein
MNVDTGNDRWISDILYPAEAATGWTADGSLLVLYGTACVAGTSSYCTEEGSSTYVFHVATDSVVYGAGGLPSGIAASPDGTLIALGAGGDVHIFPRPC